MVCARSPAAGRGSVGERRITITIPGRAPLEVSGVLAEMVVLLLARAEAFQTLRRGSWRVRFLLRDRSIRLYGPDRYDDAA